METIIGDEETRVFPKNDIREKSKRHKVKYTGGDNKRFFDVHSESGKKYTVVIDDFCDCESSAWARKTPCSHKIAAYRALIAHYKEMMEGKESGK